MAAAYDVAIVGGGAAGVGAARRLTQAGLRPILIEASARIGGRARTEHLAGLPLDLGCGWLHSADRNPWVAIAEGGGFAVDRAPTAWRAQYRDLGFPPEDQRAAAAAWAAFSARLEHDPPPSDRASDALEPGGAWNGMAEALSGYINGAALERLSVADYLAYDHAASEVNWRVAEGYGALVAASLPPIDLRLGLPVTAIDHRGRLIRLETAAGPIEAAAAIVTVSTAILAAGAIRFAPGMDDRLHAAAALPLGLADKLFLQLVGDHGLEADTHLLGNPRDARTGSYYLMPFGRPVIEAFYGGPGAEQIERQGLAAAFAFAGEELCGLFGSGFARHLRPIAASAWRGQDHVRGSYSHALPGHADRRRLLARPAHDRLFFAGEATHATDFSTAHGAYESGLRAADEAIGFLHESRS